MAFINTPNYNNYVSPMHMQPNYFRCPYITGNTFTPCIYDRSMYCPNVQYENSYSNNIQRAESEITQNGAINPVLQQQIIEELLKDPSFLNALSKSLMNQSMQLELKAKALQSGTVQPPSAAPQPELLNTPQSLLDLAGDLKMQADLFKTKAIDPDATFLMGDCKILSGISC